MPIMSISAPMADRIRYDFATLTPEQIYDHVKALEDLLGAVNDSEIGAPYIEVGDDPADVTAQVNDTLTCIKKASIEDTTANPYKDFFEDCISALNSFWPVAHIGDDTLKAVILEAIAKGDSDDV